MVPVDLFPVFWQILLQCYFSRCVFYGSHKFTCQSLLLSTSVLNDNKAVNWESRFFPSYVCNICWGIITYTAISATFGMSSEPCCLLSISFTQVWSYYRVLSSSGIVTISKIHCFILQVFTIIIFMEPLLEFGRLTAYLTRTRLFAYPVWCHLSFIESFFHYTVTQLWNLLPSDLKCHEQFADFKTHVKTYVLSLL